jgi:hypothetical protein
MAINLGITNINALPDMAMFKRTLKIQTQNGRLGVAERSQSRKMLMQGYGLSEQFRPGHLFTFGRANQCNHQFAID